MVEWANWITVTFGVQIGRSTVSLNLKKYSQICIDYTYQMEYGVTGSKCQANEDPR